MELLPYSEADYELTAALVGRDAAPLRDKAAALERYVISMFPDGARVECQMVSREDLL